MSASRDRFKGLFNFYNYITNSKLFQEKIAFFIYGVNKDYFSATLFAVEPFCLSFSASFVCSFFELSFSEVLDVSDDGLVVSFDSAFCLLEASSEDAAGLSASLLSDLLLFSTEGAGLSECSFSFSTASLGCLSF